MTKAQLIDGVAKVTGFSKKTVAEVLELIVFNLTRSLKVDGVATLHGIGIFEVRSMKARKSRNPRTGDPVDVPAHRKVGFKAHKMLRESVQ
jgi:DNA-binding protein HU-beta